MGKGWGGLGKGWGGVEDLQTFGHIFRALNRPYRGRLMAPSQLKLAEYFPNWVFPKFLNPIKLKNKYY